MIDLYCERLGPELLAEPLNAITNLAFLLAAWGSWRLLVRQNIKSPALILMVVLIAVIGIGSGLFHTFANGWSQLADVIPIMLFQLSFLALYCRKVLALQWLKVIVALVLFVVAGLAMGPFKDLINGSIVYLPAFFVLLILGVYHYRLGFRHRGILLWSAVVFVVSLSFRSMDLWVCPTFALGTHFLWHLSNGLLLYLLMKGLVTNYNRSESSQPKIG